MENQEEQEILKLLKENLAISQENLHLTRKIQRYLLWQRIIGWFYFVLIIGPLILAIIYLPPLIKSTINQYQSLLQGDVGQGQINQLPANLNLNDLLKGKLPR
jgi:hypothetical protein